MEAVADGVDVDRPLGVQPEVVQPHRRALARRHAVGALVGHGQPERLEHREHVAQGHAFAAPVDLAAQRAGRRLERTVEREVQRVLVRQTLDALHVGDGRAGEQLVPVGGREAGAVLAVERHPALLAGLLQQRLEQIVIPRADGLDDPRLQLGSVEVRTHVGGQVQRVVDAHEHPFGQPQPPVQRLRAERLGQDLADLDPVGRVEAVARDEHEAGHEALVAVRAHEQPHALTLAQLEDPDRDLVQVLDADLEQLVPRERVDDLDQRLVVVAAGHEPGALTDGLRLLAQHRDVGRHLVVGARRVEAEEAPLADDVALVVELLDADVVQVRGAVHRRAGGRLGQDERVGLAGQRAHGHRQLREARGLGPAAAQQPEPGVLDRVQRVLGELVLAVAEVREVVVGDPGEQRPRLRELVRVHARGHRLVEQRLHALAHRLPVLDGGADLLEHARDRASRGRRSRPPGGRPRCACRTRHRRRDAPARGCRARGG